MIRRYLRTVTDYIVGTVFGIVAICGVVWLAVRDINFFISLITGL